MAREINPKDTTRAAAYELWMNAPNPMVTFFKTLDVTNLIKISKKKHMKFNMLLESIHHLGKIQKKIISILFTTILSVSSYTNGWFPCRTIFKKSAK